MVAFVPATAMIAVFGLVTMVAGLAGLARAGDPECVTALRRGGVGPLGTLAPACRRPTGRRARSDTTA